MNSATQAPNARKQLQMLHRIDLIRDLAATALLTGDTGDGGEDIVAHTKLLQEIHQLQLQVETVDETTARIRSQKIDNVCIRVALEYGWLQEIARRQGENVTARQLASATNTDEKLAVRIMRPVTYQRYAEEVAHATYTANETTMKITTVSYIAAEKFYNDLLWLLCENVIPMIRESGLLQFPDKSKGEETCFEYAYGREFWDFIRHDAEMKQALDDYMSMRRDAKQPQWFEAFPATAELTSEKLRRGEDEVLVVDVGGGKGHELGKFHAQFPNVPGRLVLQDLPETIERMERVPDGIEAIGHDFFDPQPVKGARIYYFRAVLHDWPDDECRRILLRSIESMDVDYSRILIDEFVLPEVGADARPARLDVLMLLQSSGIERDLKHWEELVGSVGLEIVEVWRPEGRKESVIECKIRDR